MKKSKLRFAALIRVSTLPQAERGESLRTQEKQLRQAVKKLGGTIPKEFLYSGQEHSTPGYEREMMDSLLRDAAAGKFDAVIVADSSRWSRDNKKSKEGLEILRQHGIRFFVDTMQYDLHSPDHQFLLGVMTEANEFFARANSRKSVLSRIERAKRGWIQTGIGPYGRRINNTTKGKEGTAQWEVIPEAQEFIDKCYRMYIIDGLSFDQIGKEVGVRSETVRRRLLNGCGTQFIQNFTLDGEQITIETEIPPLLSEVKITRIQKRAKSNQVNRQIKHVYPLAHLVRCAECGSTLSGQTTVENPNNRYYRHYYLKTGVGCTLNVRATDLEKAVFSQIGQLLKKQDSLEQSIRNALGESKEGRQDLKAQISTLGKEIKGLERELDNMTQAIASGAMKEGSRSAKKLVLLQTETETRLDKLEAQQDKLKQHLANTEIGVSKDVMKQVQKVLTSLIGLNGHSPMLWPREAQKVLAQFFFGGVDKELGVFVRMHEDKKHGKYWTYEAKGVLGFATGALTNLIELADQHANEQVCDTVDPAALKSMLDAVSGFKLPLIGRKVKVSSDMYRVMY